jgi:hypothetical protein
MEKSVNSKPAVTIVSQTLRILVAYSIASAHVSTTRDYLLALKRHSAFDVSYVNVTHGGIPDFDLNEFDVIFQNYCARLCFENYVSPAYQAALADFKGLKIMSVQDEYDRTSTLRSAIKRCKFDIVLSAASDSEHAYIYDPLSTPSTIYKKVLTGYAPDMAELPENLALPLTKRPITLGYRGRDIGARYGQLGYLKYEIGRRMAQECMARGIAHDIETSEEARIYGPAWFEFIGSCRAMLGSESGSNVFDFDGSIEAHFKALRDSGNREATSYEAFLPSVAELETKVTMSEISPRIFECAAMRTPMVLFPGSYSGILVPDRHYIPLQKDFSNLEEVFTKLEDFNTLQAMSDRTYDDLIASGRFGYRAFAQFIEKLVTDHPRARAKPLSENTFGHRAVTIHSPAAEGPTPLPLQQVDYRVRQWAWLGLQLPTDKRAYVQQCQDLMTSTKKEISKYQALADQLGLDDEVIRIETSLDQFQKKQSERDAILTTYQPNGSREIEFERGLWCESQNDLQLVFNRISESLDPIIDRQIRSKNVSFPAWLFLQTRHLKAIRAKAKHILSHVPIVARITNRWL